MYVEFKPTKTEEELTCLDEIEVDREITKEIEI